MSNERIYELQNDAVELLKQLIATPSFSKEEDGTAKIICSFLEGKGVKVNRDLNNVWATNLYFDNSKSTILLNSHHDTVKPNEGYTIDPFSPKEIEGKLFGLGSNDAGASLVSLIAAFLYNYDRHDLAYNLILAATAEEEISGSNGIESLLPHLPHIDCAIIGEPTKMQMAVAERGLMVVDCISKGKAGHAAREEGENALYKAMEDIQALKNIRFEKVSELLGPVKLSVTVIETTNKAHNVVPDECRYIVDVRVNELYSLEEVFGIIQNNISGKASARSFRLRSTTITREHPLMKAGLLLGKTMYGSPTTSDKALVPFSSLKMGPGDSARSHTADEFVYINEIEKGIEDYINLLNCLL